VSTPQLLVTGPSPRAVGFTGNARFELRRVLGEGGMGVVFEAFDRERQLVVALKTVRERDAQVLYRLKTEFRARADLDHRNLVRLGELLEDGGHWFFTMELVDGWAFLDWVRNGPPDDGGLLDDSRPAAPTPAAAREARLRDAIRQLASGLDALHRTGKVHRDLKPSNVLVTRKGRVVVLDFGLVGDSSPRQPSGHDLVGTAAYMAPEQARSPAVSPAADCYSVGVILHEILTGRLPFDGAPLEILMRKQTEAPPPPQGPDVPADLAELCTELLSIDPEARPTAAAVVARVSSRTVPEDDRPTPFVGRSAELGALDAALDEVAAGSAVAVFVEGESGIGKSALVKSFVDRVETRRDGALVLAGRCYERESVPFKGIDGVVDALARELARRHPVDVALLLSPEVEALARLFPVLRRVPAIARLSVPRPASPVELRARAFRGLRHLLSALAASHALVVVIDDIQWADTDSIAVLREILHPPGAPRLLAVLTRRSDAGPPPDLPGPIRTIPLDRLTADEGRALVALLAPARAAEADALIDDAGGHPMFLQELVRHTAAPRNASRLDDALWARVTRMETNARRVLELVAVAGAPLPQGVVQQALGLDPAMFTKAIGILRATSLVRTGGTRGTDPVEPYHDRVREAVTAHVPEARCRRYHERLAAILIASRVADKDPLVVVRHLEAAGAVDLAADLAAQAARRADEALAFELAAELWAAALRLGHHDDDLRRDLLVRRAENLAYAGRGPESAEAFLAAAEGADPQAGFQCRRMAAHELLVSGHVHEGLRLLDAVLAEIGMHLPRSTAAAKRSLVWAWTRIALRGTRFHERTTPDARTLDHLRLDVMRTASLGLGMVDVLPGAAFQARALLIALRLGDPRRIAYALAYHAMYLAASGIRVPAARRLVDEARRIAEASGSVFLLGWARTGEGITEFFAGEYAKSLEILADAEGQLRDRAVGTSAELNHLRNFILFTLRRTGDYASLRERFVEYLRDALRRGDRYAATTFVWSSNVVWLAADDVARARADLASVTWSPPEDGLHLQHWFHVRAQLEIALYEDDRAAIDALEAPMRRFLGRAFAHVEAVSTETRFLLGRIAILRDDAAGARAAVAPLRKATVPYVRAWVRMVQAGAALVDGDRAGARALLTGAIADADGCGMDAIAALGRFRLGRLDGGSDGAAMVAEAEEALARRGVVSPARLGRVFATWPRLSG